MRRVSAGLPQTIDRAYAPMAFVATGVLEVERGEVQLVGALHRGERDGQVLDRQPGRVKDRDVVLRLTTGGRPCEHVAKLRHVVLRDPSGRTTTTRLRLPALEPGLAPALPRLREPCPRAS